MLLDGTVVNVALAPIQRSLGGGLAAQQWVVNGYLLTLGSLILLGGSLGDIYGERRVFTIGVIGFGVASVACALAPTIALLVVARAVQGCAGALLVPSSLAVIVNTFSEQERGAAIGSWTAWGAIAGILGPLVGGELLALSSWRAVFFVNVPLVLVCWGADRGRDPSGGGQAAGRRVDLPGAALAATGLACTVFALIEQPRLGFGDPAVSGTLIGGLLLLVGFVVREATAREPMLPLRLFERRNFSAGNVETFAVYAGLGILFLFLILFLQQIGGYSPLQSGLATLPMTLVMFLLSRRFGMLADRHGPRLFMGLGPLVGAVGLALFQRVGHDFSYVADVLPAELVFAFGLSMTVAPLTAAVLAGSEGEAGIASAVNNAVARVAGLIGTAGVGAVIAAAFSSSLQSHLRGSASAREDRRCWRKPNGCRWGCRRPPRCRTRRPAMHAAAEAASVHAFHLGIGVAAALVAAGGRRRAGLHPQPGAGEGAGRGMRRGPAGGGQQPGAGQAWPGRRLEVDQLASRA